MEPHQSTSLDARTEPSQKTAHALTLIESLKPNRFLKVVLPIRIRRSEQGYTTALLACYAGLASHVANPRIGRDGDDPSGRTVTWSAVQFD